MNNSRPHREQIAIRLPGCMAFLFINLAVGSVAFSYTYKLITLYGYRVSWPETLCLDCS